MLTGGVLRADRTRAGGIRYVYDDRSHTNRGVAEASPVPLLGLVAYLSSSDMQVRLDVLRFQVDLVRRDKL